jgi:hypothetical protein
MTTFVAAPGPQQVEALGQPVERQDVGHDRLEVERAGLDQPDRGREREGRHVRPENRQRSLRDRVLVDRRTGGLVLPNSTMPATERGVLDRGPELAADRVRRRSRRRVA